jgi:hypothetical protein
MWFGPKNTQQACYDFLGQVVGVLFCENNLNQLGAQLTSHDWVGLYRNYESPTWVVFAHYLKEFRISHVQLSAELIGTFPKSTVGSQYFTLTKKKPNV